VAVTTTGYGDIVPFSQGARLVTVVVVTPIRVAFLILVVSTTVEVLAATTRYLLRVQRWRRVMRDHYVICGYGTKGRAAAATLVSKGVEPEKVVVVEWDATTAGEATADGFTAVVGDCTRESVLSRANVASAKGVVVAVNSDSTAVLTTLTIASSTPPPGWWPPSRRRRTPRSCARAGRPSSSLPTRRPAACSAWRSTTPTRRH